MTFNDMLNREGIDPERTLLFRHRPNEPRLSKVLPWLAAERPEIYNAYQQTQSNYKVESSLRSVVGDGYVASFIGHEPGRALFVALYKVAAYHEISRQEFENTVGFQELTELGSKTWVNDDSSNQDRTMIDWFDLIEDSFYSAWKGKLVVDWPGPERAWYRRAEKNVLNIHAIHEESMLDDTMPDWRDMKLTWQELSLLPTSWRKRLAEWRGVYYIFSVSEHKGYVGAAYGTENILGRWESYTSTGHGGNKLLRNLDPKNFTFSILERVSPDLPEAEVIRIESGWKQRLSTISPTGLNEN